MTTTKKERKEKKYLRVMVGDEVRHSSGRTGIVTGRVVYPSKRTSIGVQPFMDGEDLPPSFSCREEELEVICQWKAYRR